MEELRKFTRRIDPGFVVVLAISLIAIWPFISIPSLPEGTDAELHIFRLAELSYLLRGGEIFPRWAPNFYHGYGYPIFNYYAPLTYYLGFLLEITPWFDAVTAVKGIFMLGMLLGGLGVYGFVRDYWGRAAGYVATAVFLYAPYIQYVDPHVRGVLPETFSFGIFACALWALDRLNRSGGRFAWLTAVFLTAAVILSHNLMGLLFFGILLGWVVWQIIGRRKQPDGRYQAAWQLPLAGLLLGLGLAAIFWLPVILERNAVNLNTLIGEGDNYDFHTHFLTLREMLAPSLRLDWGATEPAFRFNLGVAQWILGGLGIVMLLLRRVKAAWQAAFFALALLILLILMLPVSTFAWENLPFLPYFQFPWRLLGAAAVILAILAGAGVAAVLDLLPARRSWASAGVTAVFVLFPILLGLPLSQPPPWPDFGEVNHLRMTMIENTGRWLGTTSTADYVPATVETFPERKGSVVSNFAAGLPPDRINHAMLPAGSTIETETIRPLLTRYTIDTPRATRLRLFLFDFPGWQVRIDGERVETELGKPEGFLVIPVPAGRHIIDVEFGDTPARSLAALISLVTLAVTLLAAWRLPRQDMHLRETRFGRSDWLVLGCVVLITAVFAFLLVPSNSLHFNSRGNTAEPAQSALYADFGEQIALLGFDASQTTARPGEIVDITLYWKAQQPLDINYQVFVHVLGLDGTLAAQSDKLNPGEFPTRRWPDDKYVRDVNSLLLPQELPAGDYVVATGIWVASEGWRLPLLDAGGQQIGDNVTLFILKVE